MNNSTSKMEKTMFSELPSEMIHEILKYVKTDFYINLYPIREFKKILNNPRYWDITYKSIINFDHRLCVDMTNTSDFYTYYYDYIKLKQINSKIISFMENQDIKYFSLAMRKIRTTLVSVLLKNIKNFKVLSLYFTTEVDHEIEREVSSLWLKAYENDTDTKLLILRNFHGYIFSIETNVYIKQYKVSRKDVLNLLAHIFYNDIQLLNT